MTVVFRNLTCPQALVQAWLDLLPAVQAATLTQLHEAVMAGSPGLRAEVKWGNVQYGHERRTLVCLTPSRRGVQVQLFCRAGQVPRSTLTLEKGPASVLFSVRHHHTVPRAEITNLVRQMADFSSSGRTKSAHCPSIAGSATVVP